MVESITLPKIKRVCYCCGSDKTYVMKNGVSHWYPNHDEDKNVLCSRCYIRLINNPRTNPKRSSEYDSRRIETHGERFIFKVDPHIGVCNWCRAVKPWDCERTNMHHDENRWDPYCPLRYTIELCMSCHGKETARLKEEGEFQRYPPLDYQTNAGLLASPG